jgi:rod shape-determining protein MreD
MIKDVGKYFVYFALLVLLQIFVLNNIQLSGYINPMIYILFILLLPFEISGWLLLLLGFATGLTIDMFMNTLGMHSSATIAMAYARPHVISFLSQRVDADYKGAPTMKVTGLQWYVRYTVTLVFIHHFFLFFIETLSFIHFLPTLWRIIVSTLITSSVVLLVQYFTVQKK